MLALLARASSAATNQEEEGSDRPRAWELESGTVRKDRPDAQLSINPGNDEPGRFDRLSGPAPQLTSRAQVMGFARECAVSILERYVVIVWRREIALAGAQWARKALLHMRRAKPDGALGIFMLANEGCDVSANPHVRSELANLLGTYGERISGVAVAYEGSPLRLSMLRGIATAISMTSRTRVPVEVFNSGAAATWWLHGKTRSEGDGVSAEDLLHVAEHLSIKA